MAANGDKTDKMLNGIQLILGEMRDLKEEARQDRREMAEMMRRWQEEAAADRRQAAEDRRQATEGRKVLMQIGTAMTTAMVALQHSAAKIAETQKDHTKLLAAILKTLHVGFNGKGGNGK